MLLKILIAVHFSLSAFATEGPTTISGLSSGAFMAAQMHVAHSKTIKGVAILAGGPYGCSGGSVSGALFVCMRTLMGKPSGADLFADAIRLGEAGRIDPVSNLQGSRVVLVTGPNDTTVYSSVVYENKSFYASLKRQSIKVIDDLPVGHAFPTVDKGNACETGSQSPWVSACGRDVAGEILNHLYGELQEPGLAKDENFFQFSQVENHSMDSRGIAYVPESCQTSLNCPVHMSLHGCQQGISRGVGEFYFRNVGFNEWAESNGIIIVYPQAISSLGNPNQCWDWWGYLESDYKTQSAPQIKALKSLLDQFENNSIELQPYQPSAG